MPVKILKITCLSNLHVGSGDESYGVIDNLVQRDATDGLPCINGPSLKGALREHLKNEASEALKFIFGGSDQGKESDSGNYSFTQASLLAIPVRSNATPFFMCTSPHVRKNFEMMYANLIDDKIPDFVAEIPAEAAETQVWGVTSKEVYLEDYEVQAKVATGTKPNLSKVLNGHTAIGILNANNFKLLTDDLHLPVRARNRVAEKDKNLWYEQYVPRQTVFYSFLILPEGENYWNVFEKSVVGKVVQLGANKSVGDGLCLVETLN